MAAAVHASRDYETDDLKLDRRFADILRVTPEGERVIDLTRFHDTEPVSTERMH